jgi:tRNA(Ile2) C34 agmatinyltransferase TiaS
MNKLKIWFLNYFKDAELCPKCGVKMQCQGYHYLDCPKCKEKYFCEYGNSAHDGKVEDDNL